MQGDWLYFSDAARAVLTGANPYGDPGFFSAPWALPIFVLMLIIMQELPRLLPVAVLVILAYRARKPWLIFVVGTSFSFVALVAYANLDWLSLVGLYVSGPLSILFLTIKPQSSALAVLGDIRGKSWQQLAVFVAPFAAVVLVSTLAYPMWLSQMLGAPKVGVVSTHNFSLMPYSLLPGLLAAWQAWRCKSRFWGVVASLCIAPYWYITSLTPLLYLAAEHDWRWGVALNIGTWLIVALVLAGVLRIVL
jgi:hypothetical protein